MATDINTDPGYSGIMDPDMALGGLSGPDIIMVSDNMCHRHLSSERGMAGCDTGGHGCGLLTLAVALS